MSLAVAVAAAAAGSQFPAGMGHRRYCQDPAIHTQPGIKCRQMTFVIEIGLGCLNFISTCD